MNKKKPTNSKQFRNELKNNKLERIYLFTGEEEGEKEKIIKIILEMVFPDMGDGNRSVGRFHIEDDEFMKAVDFALSRSMFVDRNICLMLNLKSLQRTDSNIELLREVIEDLPDSNILILTTSENRVPKIIPSALLGKIKIVQFWRYFESDIYNYISQSIAKNGIAIEGSAISLMIELVGRDIRKIDDAIEKIINSGETGSITREVVDALIEDERDVSIYEFLDSLFKKQTNVYYLLRKVNGEGVHELGLLSMIMRQAESIEKFHSLIRAGFSVDKTLAEIKISSRNRENFLKYIEKNPSEEISRIFPMVYRTDFRIKSTNYSGDIAANPIFDLITDYLHGGVQKL